MMELGYHVDGADARGQNAAASPGFCSVLDVIPG
jgi:hypothetical protein